MIFVSIGEPTVKACAKAVAAVKCAEIRMDRIKPGEEGIAGMFSKSGKQLIATCRPTSGRSEEERKNLLLDAIAAGAAYVDVEVEASDAYKKEIVSAARKRGCKAIISYHNYEKTPNSAELEQIVEWCFDSGADIAKIACNSSSDADNARLLGLLDSDRKLVVIGMGAKGRITRIVGPLLGCVFTFASSEKGKETAEGQIDGKTLEKLIGELENA